MCGIFGYLGNKTNAGELVLKGIKRLDYRGYDSWGVAVVTDGEIYQTKNVGIVEAVPLPLGDCAIGHTRWATTGEVSKVNAHPHLSSDKSFTLAQNGIVENCQVIKNQLKEKGYQFISQTDTEVIVRLIEDKQKLLKNLESAVARVLKELTGRNTIMLVTKTGQILAARNGSPLVVGKNRQTGDIFLSSDTLSFNGLADQLLVVDNWQMVVITKDGLKLIDLVTNQEIRPKFKALSMDKTNISKGKYVHFMLKEIFEGPEAITKVAKLSYKQLIPLVFALKKAARVYTIGSGGAGVAAAQVAFDLRRYAKIPAMSLIGAEALEYLPLFTKNDIILAISQSGETADVLEVLESAKASGTKIASFVNMPGSMISRMSDYAYLAQSGAEICVMSTKTFDAQVAFGYLVAQAMAGKVTAAKKELIALAVKMRQYLDAQDNHEAIQQVADSLYPAHDIFLLGKYANYQIAREGMIKIIEATYKHGHTLPAGDLKHYVITLMEPGVQVITLVAEDETKRDMINAIDQVRLRGAKVLGIASQNLPQFDQFLAIPDCGQLSNIMSLVPLQLLAYYLARQLGNSIDKPRHIAKSVTVK